LLLVDTLQVAAAEVLHVHLTGFLRLKMLVGLLVLPRYRGIASTDATAVAYERWLTMIILAHMEEIVHVTMYSGSSPRGAGKDLLPV
jgi:hypothetical protein